MTKEQYLNQIINNASSKISSLEEYTEALLNLAVLGKEELSWDVAEAYCEISHQIKNWESK